MKKSTKVALVVGLLLFVSLGAALWIAKYTDFPEVFAAKKQPCAIGRLCKGTITQAQADKKKGSTVTGHEGCLTDYRDANGSFYTVRSSNCGSGKKENPPIAMTTTTTPPLLPTYTPTPTPTCTPTPTPTPGPTSTPTPTPTPMPPQVVYIREIPKQLPPTGFPTDAVAGGAILSGSLGWFLVRHFRA